MTVSIERNASKEDKQRLAFTGLQAEIVKTFGEMPCAPQLASSSVAQTSVVLEWGPLKLHQSTLLGIDVFRDTQKLGLAVDAGATRVKVSGLAVQSRYSFSVVVRTSAGALSSNVITVETRPLEDLAGLHVCIADDVPEAERKELVAVVAAMEASQSASITLATTHVVCRRGEGALWESAGRANVPIVTPDFLLACQSNGKVQAVGPFYVPAVAPSSST